MRRIFTVLTVAILSACGANTVHVSESVEEVKGQYRSVDCISDRERFLELDFWTFDQDPELGHRAISSKPGCEIAAADLIRDYHEVLREQGAPVLVEHPNGTYPISSDGEVMILYWHEGQSRALLGQDTMAIELFKKSIVSDPEHYPAWNEYARATIAFMEGDFRRLEIERDALAAYGEISVLNLGVVDGLIACFGRSYTEAYASDECDHRIVPTDLAE